tara:strand:+ start:2735 stop:3094 length:360 start_codon:yes stop_codon:yes gene_type:complete
MFGLSNKEKQDNIESGGVTNTSTVFDDFGASVSGNTLLSGPPFSAAPTTLIRMNIARVIKKDLEAQGGSTENLDMGRVARSVVRELRSIDDSMFKAAGLNPKFHKDKFIKVLDEIMRGL